MNNLNNTNFHLPYNPQLVERAKYLRKNMTIAEQKLWKNYFKNFKYRILRQRPIDHFIVDFYCPSLKLMEIVISRIIPLCMIKLEPKN